MPRGAAVAYFGTLLPDPKGAARLTQAPPELSGAELTRQAASTPQRQAWQRECNLRTLIAGAGG